MADINDINSWIIRAQGLEKSNPSRAHAIYEAAERKLDELLYKSVFPNSPFYESIKRTIIMGYERLDPHKLL